MSAGQGAAVDPARYGRETHSKYGGALIQSSSHMTMLGRAHNKDSRLFVVLAVVISGRRGSLLISPSPSALARNNPLVVSVASTWCAGHTGG